MRRAFLAAVAVIAAGVASASAGAGGGVRIETRTVDGLLELRALAEAGPELQRGSYSFTIEKQGPSGRSNVNQGGRFDAAAQQRETVVLTTSRMSLGDDDRLRAVLRVTTPEGGVYEDSYVFDRSNVDRNRD